MKALSLPCYLNLSMVRLKQDKYLECAKYATKALELDKSNHKALFRRGRAYRLNGDYAEAEADFDKAINVVEITSHQMPEFDEVS